MICTGSHKVEEYNCGIAGCNKKKGKICVHVVVKCTNCGRNYTAYFPQYTSKQKANIEVRKQKKRREKSGKEKTQAENSRKEKMVENPKPDTEMDLEDKQWAQSP